MRSFALICLAAAVSQAALVGAESQSEAELRREIEILKEQVRELQAAVAGQRREIADVTQTAAAAPVAPPETAGIKGKTGTLLYLPEIGLVADMVATASKTLEDDEGNNRLSVREVEMVLGSDIDPYARLDATLSLSDLEEAELEEAYATYWGLPGELMGRLGRFHQRIGRAAQLHRDSLDTVDEPLVVQRYLGEHGVHQSGIEIEGFTPLSADSFTQRLTLGVMEGGAGHGGTLFGSEAGKPTLYGHLSNFKEFGDRDDVELGATYLCGADQNNRSFEVNVWAFDAVYQHRLASQQKLKLQSEFFMQRRPLFDGHGTYAASATTLKHSHEEEQGGEQDSHLAYAEDSRGLYALADWRFSPSWGAGARYDWVQPIAIDQDYARSAEQAGSIFMTFYQSEFARWRAQYQRAALVDGRDDDRFFLQGTFAIGSHKHKLQ